MKRMQSPLAQANSFIWQVRLGQFWSSSAALAQSFSPSHTKLIGTQRGWPGCQVGQVNWSELQVRSPAGGRKRMRWINYTLPYTCKLTHSAAQIFRANMMEVCKEENSDESVISPHSSSGVSSLLSEQSLLPSHTIDSGMQFPLVHVNWLELQVLI